MSGWNNYFASDIDPDDLLLRRSFHRSIILLNFIIFGYKRQNFGGFSNSIAIIESQRQIVSQIEKEQALFNASKQLIEIFEQKIKDRIAKAWGENDMGTMAAEE